MNPRVEYKMTQEDLDEILNACKPVPCIMIGGREPASQQENANAAWARLGEKMGFESMTVEPDSSDKLKFTAVPSETDAQREDRETRESNEKKAKNIADIKSQISLLEDELAALE